MIRTPLFLLLAALAAGCERQAQTNADPFGADPTLAKQKTGECLQRLEHAILEQRADIVEQLTTDANCLAASAAHAEHVNNGLIEAVSREQGDDHHHH